MHAMLIMEISTHLAPINAYVIALPTFKEIFFLVIHIFHFSILLIIRLSCNDVFIRSKKQMRIFCSWFIYYYTSNFRLTQQKNHHVIYIVIHFEHFVVISEILHAMHDFVLQYINWYLKKIKFILPRTVIRKLTVLCKLTIIWKWMYNSV